MSHHRDEANEFATQILATANAMDPKSTPISIATISSGFEKGDFLVREEKGQRVYFDFFEEAFNYIAYKGYIRMSRDDEREWMDTMNGVHASVKGGMKYNTGKLLMVLFRPIEVDRDWGFWISIFWGAGFALTALARFHLEWSLASRGDVALNHRYNERRLEKSSFLEESDERDEPMVYDGWIDQ